MGTAGNTFPVPYHPCKAITTHLKTGYQLMRSTRPSKSCCDFTNDPVSNLAVPILVPRIFIPVDIIWEFWGQLIDRDANTLRPRQNGRHFPDDIFKCIFLNENAWLLVKISPKFVPKFPMNNIPALVQIMASRRPGAKPLSEPTTVSLLMNICVTWPQLVKSQTKY